MKARCRPQGPAPATTTNNTSTPQSADKSQSTALVPYTGVARWWRRQRARQRMVPLDCGCIDPWPCRCTTPPLTDHALDSWRDAAQHILATGRVPIVPLEVRRALWRRGDRELAERLHDACGGQAA
jgi:hypothetical protein